MGVLIAAVVVISVISTITTVTETVPLSFNFTSFEFEPCSDGAVRLYGDAHCAGSGGVRITGFNYYVSGQARYPKPMRLWDRSTGQLANFTTAFTFAIDNAGGSWTCDGLAFFLASADYAVTPTRATQGRLGLVDGNYTYNATAAGNPFVAVEFDTYNNIEWDTWGSESHVGIDVSSMKSEVSKRWKSYVDGSTLMWDQVSYDGRKLCARFTGMTENLTDVIPMDSLCYEMDLRNYLTEWAVFGFSASTAWRYQSHTIYSWSFSSDLDSGYD